jgi:hypothetical protein
MGVKTNTGIVWIFEAFSTLLKGNLSGMAINSTNINKANKHISPQTIELKNTTTYMALKSRS